MKKETELKILLLDLIWNLRDKFDAKHNTKTKFNIEDLKINDTKRRNKKK